MAPKKESSPKKVVTKKGPAKKEIIKSVKKVPDESSKAEVVEKKQPDKAKVTLAEHIRVQTAEGWKRSMKKQGLL